MSLESNPNKVKTKNKYLTVESCPKLKIKGLTKKFVSLVRGLNIKYKIHKHYFYLSFMKLDKINLLVLHIIG